MKSERENVKKSVDKLGVELGEEKKEQVNAATDKLGNQGYLPKDIMGVSDAMVEGIYGQAYRLYNTGKYTDAAQLFRTMVMMNPTEPRYAMGLAACSHMLKDYQRAIEQYTYASMLDADNPVPAYHTSDCCIQMGDQMSAIIALEMAIKRAGNKPEYAVLKDRANLTLQSLKREFNIK